MHRISLIILLHLVLSFSAQAEEPPGDSPDKDFGARVWNYLTEGASITAGVGGRSVGVDVTRIGTNDHGKIVENKEDELFLFYSTKARYFGTSNVGYSWLLNLSTMHLKEQELSDGSIVNLGTGIDGRFASIVPTVFYNFGDRHRGHHLRAGIGLGIGFADFSGDIVLTESTQTNDRVSVSNGASTVFFAFGVFIDYQWKNLIVRLSNAGPNIEYGGYDVNVSGTSLVLGYRYYL